MKNTIEEIVALEWDMFQLVNEGGERADCQEEYETFQGMRFGQFATWSESAQESYLEDLRAAKESERNLVEEKYIWMMIEGSPEMFLEMSPRVKLPTERATELADAVCEMMINQTAQLHEIYPTVAGSGRPLYATDENTGTVSVETYQYSELITYSEKTLEALYQHISELESRNIMLAELILTNSVRHYGYNSLSEAESVLSGGAEGSGDA